MSGHAIRDAFLKCKKCEVVNRIIAVGLADAQIVNCSQCGAALGAWSTIKRVVSSYDAGRVRFKSSDDELKVS
ncbi:MAG TPA: hypothetical protein VHG92_11200 [Afifellaceae bacterium]|nr:hypothetical protein [Afifellaceae bacterium]